MRTKVSGNVLVAVALFALAAVVFLGGRLQPAYGVAQDKGGAGPRYSVLDTEATNLIVTDNQTNVLYFYTVERDGKPGDDLKLRGSLDLNKVGEPVLKPKVTKKEDKEGGQ